MWELCETVCGFAETCGRVRCVHGSGSVHTHNAATDASSESRRRLQSGTNSNRCGATRSYAARTPSICSAPRRLVACVDALTTELGLEEAALFATNGCELFLHVGNARIRPMRLGTN